MRDPRTYNLPAKFSEYRAGQTKALDTIEKTNAKFVILQAPTGTGKTLISTTIQRMYDTKMLYLVRTKQLEDQIKSDFPYAEVLKGRSNYHTYLRADQFPAVHAGMCTRRKGQHCIWCCTGEDEYEESCTAHLECPYHMAKVQALRANLAVLNMSLFLNEANYIGGFSKRDWITVDEADTLEESLLSFVEFSVSRRFIKQLNIPPPAKKTVEESWVDWAKHTCRPRFIERIEELNDDWQPVNIPEEDRLTAALERLNFFIKDIEENPWVYTPSEGAGYVFKPVFVAKYAQDNMWRHGKRFLCMSATIVSPQQFCKDLSIAKDDAVFIDLKSEFDARRRPIFYTPTVSITNSTKAFAWPLAVKGLDKSLDKYKSVKVLVHTVSGGLAKHVYENSRHQGRMIVYGFNGVSREAALKKFMQVKEPAVLVAQSMDRGVDLADETCRVIIILKVPYLDLSDKQISKRVYAARDGNSWYQTQTWRTLIQMSGRGVRHSMDFCVTEIHDAQFGEKLWKNSKKLAPSWWVEALRLPKGMK